MPMQPSAQTTISTRDSLGIVTLATEAFKRGHLEQGQVRTLHECADGFTQILSVANRYRQATGKKLRLDDLPSPRTLLAHISREDYGAALKEAATINVLMRAIIEGATLELQNSAHLPNARP